MPWPALALLLVVDVGTAALVGSFALSDPFTDTALERVAIVCALALLFTELVARSERLRRYLNPDDTYLNARAVWAYAIVLLLPPGPAAAVVALLAIAIAVRERNGGAPVSAHRLVYTTATVALAALAAGWVVAEFPDALTFLPGGAADALAVVAGLVAYQVVNQGLVAAIVYLTTRPTALRDALPSAGERALETAWLVTGALTAQCIVVQPWLSPTVLAVIVVLERGALVHQLQLAATTDAKTSLLNAGGWRRAALAQLRQALRASKPVALLLADLDHFKQINDTFGHLAGDRVLAAVGACLREELRAYDAIGRFGGEEFVVVLTGVDRREAESIADRLRCAITKAASDARMTVTASLGLAHSGTADVELDELIGCADSALYVAKAAGRDRIAARTHA